MINLKRFILLASVFALFACSSVEETVEIPNADTSTDTADENVSTQGMGERAQVTITTGGRLVLDGTDQEGSALSQQTIYFDFDSAEIRADFAEALQAHGAYLVDNPGARLRLEGHADERGTREYNIGLGEERAQAVRQYLMLQGASSIQIATISFGEERPVNSASNEMAYRQNRRVELVYTRAN